MIRNEWSSRMAQEQVQVKKQIHGDDWEPGEIPVEINPVSKEVSEGAGAVLDRIGKELAS
jgi:hypothetical protein